MKIETQKELESLLRICRKHGVRSIEVDGMKMTIDEQREDKKLDVKEDASIMPQYTEEQMLTWSSAPSIEG